MEQSQRLTGIEPGKCYSTLHRFTVDVAGLRCFDKLNKLSQPRGMFRQFVGKAAHRLRQVDQAPC